MQEIGDFSDLRVLVVEDEGLILMLLEEHLLDLGCRIVATASRLDTALVQARSAPVNMAILDVNLAGRLSYPVAMILIERHIPFIFATGYGAPAVPSEMQNVPILAKPFFREQLAKMLVSARKSVERRALEV